VLEIERHLVWIAVGEDQVVRPVELGQNISGLTADDADTVAVPVPCDLELGEAHVLGVAFDLLDEPAPNRGRGRAPRAERILEVGCGLGYSKWRLPEQREADRWRSDTRCIPRPCVSRCS